MDGRQEDVTCPLHDQMQEQNTILRGKIDKIESRLFWILILVALSLFFGGANVTKEVLTAVLALSG
jgi:hypothetical protein